MNFTQLNIIYKKLEIIIPRLNNMDLSQLDSIISEKTQEISEESFDDWMNSVLSITTTHYKSDKSKELLLSYKSAYSIPFLHLKDNGWFSAIKSKEQARSKITAFLTENLDIINRLSESVVTALQYIDIDGDLTEDQQALFINAQNFVAKNYQVVDRAASLIEEVNVDRNNISIDLDEIRENIGKYSKYFYTTDATSPILDTIQEQSLEITRKLELVSIKKIREQIKETWLELKKETFRQEIKIKNNIKLLKLFEDLPLRIFRVFFQFNDLNDVINATDADIRRIDNLNDEEIIILKERADNVLNSIKERVYPKLNSEHLSESQIELLSLLKQYKEYPQNRDQNVARVLDGFNKLSNDVSAYLALAPNRKKANLLDDEKYQSWIQQEYSIYEEFNNLLNAYREITPPPKKTKNPDILKQDFNDNSADYYANAENITGEKQNASTNGLPSFVVNKVKETKLNTKDLKATLRPYQIFAAKYILTFKRVLLGDEMGLGKTLESLSVANHLYQSDHKHIIAISPYSVLANWEREIQNKTKLPVYIFHNSDRYSKLSNWEKYGGILLTNYEQCRLIETSLSKIDLTIVDEAHNIKNSKALRTKSVKQILAISDYKLLMTGTPLENRLDEMSALISMLNSSLGSQINANPYINKKDFKNEIASIYLRRKRNDVLKELPLINMVESWSDFNEDQLNYYRAAIAEGENGLLKMRRAAFIGSKSEKIDQIKHICEDARSNGDKVVIFSFFKNDVIYRLQNEIKYTAPEPITGDITSSKKRQDIIDEFANNSNESVLICQITAGGVGLNIQAANQVIICEPQWKPSIENQAIGRVYRMGQTKNVTVYHLLTKNSIDETMMNILQYKQNLFDKYADDSVAAKMIKISDIGDTVLPSSKIEQQVFSIEKGRLEKLKA